MRPTYQVTELLGDGIGPELSRSIHALADALPVRLEFLAVDLTLENRRARGRQVYDEAVESITATRVALKHPTVTAEESPNAILRRREQQLSARSGTQAEQCELRFERIARRDME